MKVKLAERDFDGARKLLGDRDFSDDVISFLNLRAIMAIRSGRFDEGVEFYVQTLRGASDAKDTRAKLRFNLGLAYARHSDLEKAQENLLESLKIGGPRFQRAKGPLEVVKAEGNKFLDELRRREPNRAQAPLSLAAVQKRDTVDPSDVAAVRARQWM